MKLVAFVDENEDMQSVAQEQVICYICSMHVCVFASVCVTVCVRVRVCHCVCMSVCACVCTCVCVRSAHHV